jgi:hypothetical protein
MKAHFRISVKDYSRNKNLKIQLVRVPFGHNRQFWVRMNGECWPKDGRPVSITRLLVALRKSLVNTVANSQLRAGRNGSEPDSSR